MKQLERLTMRNDFAVFILTHGRPNNQITLNALLKSGYTGKYFLVIDDEDETEQEYKKKYKDKVIQFNKLEISKTFDTADLSQERRTIIYARNACFDIAKKMGIRFFLELDDDYTYFASAVARSGKLKRIFCKNIDKMFSAMIDFMCCSNISSVAFAQGGDFLGGVNGSKFQQVVLRKAMNTFFCDTEKPFQFLGRINEDVNTYTTLSQRGVLFFTICLVSIFQKETQSNKGGMTDAYIDGGTYIKSFPSVMMSPSCVKIGMMGNLNKRIHHHVKWNNCAPCILSDKYKIKSKSFARTAEQS